MENGEAALAAVRRMTADLARRGPDAEGLDCFPTAVLGHRRLAIFDLSEAGKQPMRSADGSLGVVFNGAIYNFKRLREELEYRGCQFRTATDTEVLLHGYQEWGLEPMVRRLRGMFAFGFWDENLKKLYLVRDRLGVKPLVWAEQGSALAFASTVRALFAGGFGGEIDEAAVLDYLEFGWVTQERAIYEGIHKLPPATILEWSASACRQWQYWAPPVTSANGVSFEDAVARTEELFLESVKLRLEADVTVGALLSGGVDSSLVCWAIAKLGANIKAFTIGTDGLEDETPAATATAQQLGIHHEVIRLSGDSWPGLEELVSAYGEPFSTTSALGILRVSRTVRQQATVLLTGDGGDDVFLGYPEHRHFRLAQLLAGALRFGPGQAWLTVKDALPRKGVARRAANFLNYATGGLGAVAQARDGLPYYEQHGLLAGRLAGATVAARQLRWSMEAGRRVLDDFLAYDRITRFVCEYLTKVDCGAMYYALEARSPFLDQELWQMAAALPYEVRLRKWTLKAVLRELARRHLGARVAEGPKQGFTVPIERWMTTRWRAAVTESFSDSQLARNGWIHGGKLLSHWQSVCNQDAAPAQLWRLYVLEAWLRDRGKSQR